MERLRWTPGRARLVAWLGIAALACGACAAHAPVASPRQDDAPPAAAAPLEVARAFYAALHAGDAAAAGRLVATPNGARVAEAFVAIAGAYRRLEEALRAAYGDEATRAIGYRARIEAEDEAMARATQSIRDQDAVIAAGDPLLATLRRDGGTWRVVLDDALTTDDGVAALAREAAATRTAAERVAPAVRSRLFGSAADALEAFRNEVSARVGEAPDLPAGAGEGQPPVAL